MLEKDGKIIWTDRVRNEEVLLRVNEQRNIIHEISKRKAGALMRRNCILQRVIDGKIKGRIEMTGRRRRRRRKLLDDLNPSAWSDGHCPHAARSHSFVYISTS